MPEVQGSPGTPALDPTNAELLAKAKGGNRQALGELMLRLGEGIASRLRINAVWRPILEPLEIIQVTYLEAFLEFSTFDGDERSFEGWLERIAKNNLADAVNSLGAEKRPQPQYRVLPPSDIHPAAWLLDLSVGQDRSPSSLFGLKETMTILDAELNKLPDDYGRVLRLFYLEGRSVHEVATVMKRSMGAVYLLKRRAAERLALQLGSQSRFFR